MNSFPAAGLDAKIPLMVYNGTMVVDNEDRSFLIKNFFDQGIYTLLEELLHRQICPIVYSFIDGRQRLSFIPEKCTQGMKRFLDSRKGDVRIRIALDTDDLCRGEIFYITCIDAHKNRTLRAMPLGAVL